MDGWMDGWMTYVIDVQKYKKRRKKSRPVQEGYKKSERGLYSDPDIDGPFFLFFIM
jgi:hypothetical protein